MIPLFDHATGDLREQTCVAEVMASFSRMQSQGNSTFSEPHQGFDHTRTVWRVNHSRPKKNHFEAMLCRCLLEELISLEFCQCVSWTRKSRRIRLCLEPELLMFRLA